MDTFSTNSQQTTEDEFCTEWERLLDHLRRQGSPPQDDLPFPQPMTQDQIIFSTIIELTRLLSEVGSRQLENSNEVRQLQLIHLNMEAQHLAWMKELETKTIEGVEMIKTSTTQAISNLVQTASSFRQQLRLSLQQTATFIRQLKTKHGLMGTPNQVLAVAHKQYTIHERRMEYLMNRVDRGTTQLNELMAKIRGQDLDVFRRASV